MENQRLRSDNSSHSDEDRDSGNGSEKDIGIRAKSQYLSDREAPSAGTPSPPVIKCPKKDVLRKLEEEEKLRLARVANISLPPAGSSPVPNRPPSLSSSPKKLSGYYASETKEHVALPKKESSLKQLEISDATLVFSLKRSSPTGASAEVRLKLQQFLARRQEQRGSCWQADGALPNARGSHGGQRDRQTSSSSEGSTTFSQSGSESESPPITAVHENSPTPKKNIITASDLTLKVKSALRQKVMEGRTSPITKNEKIKNKTHAQARCGTC
ncbi:hypothetical protein BIW11_10072 [Tropilaelaps mercedesae]|uniref:Uncharacterized protein n=1 Tax=Tropilaelaps mercedesae TaxID=418985 RepID=A0A1V9XHE2_9ACAR|nr:hypothetical protein BIW11_10072 [Tropilaelaps mercedesae]